MNFKTSASNAQIRFSKDSMDCQKSSRTRRTFLLPLRPIFVVLACFLDHDLPLIIARPT